MQVTPKSRLQIRLQNIFFVVLFLAIMTLLAWLSLHYKYESDWTASGRHTLSEATVTLLERMEGPVKILAFARSGNLVSTRRNIAEMIERYRQHKDDIHIRYINPETEPDMTREYDISVDGELVVTYNDRTEHVQDLSEAALTNTLQQLLRSGEKHIVFVAGHGERNPEGRANHDYGRFAQHLRDKGIKSSTLRLSDNPAIPADTAALVIAGPQLDYLPGEVEIIRDYVRNGGNMLWLHDPGKLYGLQPLLQELGLDFVPGTIVDPSTQMLGINDPTFTVIADYSASSHPITRDFRFMTLFPRAAAIKTLPDSRFKAEPFLQTVPRSWVETGKLDGVINYDEGEDTAGPLHIGVAVTPDTADEEQTDHDAAGQRIAVLGDGDFLANAYLGNQGNQDLGYNIINWLSHDDAFIDIPSRTAPDTELTLDSLTWSILGLLFLFGLPLLLLGYGLYIWWQRRKP
ncbi:GldG family protein [Thiohalophilus sp.]|uniref:GldG family protein n=1 Tax=Thiohalophilus sp. TaxID=3028392 RepID=UPI002ACE90A5|nr:GldG family protein [Thiohalophilus sp.]MDZ7661781.1 GldG family protein [Thiohalophilus sp.]